MTDDGITMWWWRPDACRLAPGVRCHYCSLSRVVRLFPIAILRTNMNVVASGHDAFSMTDNGDVV